MSEPMTLPDEALPMAPAVPQVRELHTRFLFPFLFDRGQVANAVQALTTAKVAGRTEVWNVTTPSGLYSDELTRHVARFLFHDNPESNPAPYRRAAYLHLPKERLQELLPKGIVAVFDELGKSQPVSTAKASESEAPKTVPVSVLHGEGVELFLSEHGVGVLSLTLVTHDLETDTAIEFNYRLSHLRRASGYLHVPHPRESPETWGGIPSEHQAEILRSDAEHEHSSPIGRRGESFTLNELRLELLQPLVRCGYKPAADKQHTDELFQPQLSVFTVARFDSTVDLSDADTRGWVGDFLSALAQIEEPSHAGLLPGQLPIPNEVLNRCHWAAATRYAAAHALTDQPSSPARQTDHPFNIARVPRVRDKYFIPYLAALMQRLVLHRALEKANDIQTADPGEKDDLLAALRKELLEFTLGGQFGEISHRQAVHRFYQIVHRGLALTDTWRELHEAIVEFDSRNLAARQEQTQLAIHHLAERQARTQHAAHTIELLVFSIYGAHMMFMLIEAGEWFKHHEFYRVALVLAGAVAGFVCALGITKIYEGKSEADDT